ncbi:hypothetical protein KXV92_007530 [Aspergillus fumigatus]|nr:hypothetical protein KXX42_003601 [Aspergillus fumigatus]KAH3002787.1 hypothetical protein KXW60_006598 [Aspergillus fumigatus]KAH3182054.1 hypothetical protein KXV92_007530 [Aspergillus fumigatus]KAH3265240.1 hypothetical protein KXW55_006808 [Aspergillus fumigatus]KAH3536110.1 hypothetical protein KXV64_009500 [Aspergillus fumigatus]
MSLLHSEWTAFLAQNPTVSHDDESRNRRFLSSPEGRVLAEQVSSVDTTVPARDNHLIPIRIYTPKDHSSDAVVIFYHSGGFVQGSLDTEDISCRHMALGGPSTVISVDYRLSPAHQYPIPLNDGWDSFEYIITNLPTLLPKHGASARVVISGTSSGGQIQQRQQDLHQSWTEELETAKLDRQGIAENHDLLGVPWPERAHPDAYPLWGRFDGLPKTYVQICDVDILRDDAVCYVRGLQNADIAVRVSFYQSLPHIFWVYAPQLEVSRQAQDDCVNGLRWLLGLTE